MSNDNKISAVILAGGRSRRMNGQDKGLLPLDDVALIDYVIAAVKPQVDTLIISANRHVEEYLRRGYPVMTDNYGEYEGPLAGILTALQLLPDDHLLFVIPCDMPVVPTTLVKQLVRQLHTDNADLCCLKIQQRLQPLISIIKKTTLTSLNNYLCTGKHKVQDWVEQLHYATISIDDSTLININTPEDLNAFKKQLDK